MKIFTNNLINLKEKRAFALYTQQVIKYNFETPIIDTRKVLEKKNTIYKEKTMEESIEKVLENNGLVVIKQECNLWEKPADIYRYKREISELTGEDNDRDLIGADAIADKKGNIELGHCYKDVKILEFLSLLSYRTTSLSYRSNFFKRDLEALAIKAITPP